MIYQDNPVGAIDGSNTVFTLSYVPAANSLQFYLNGLLLRDSAEYTLSNATVTLVSPPLTGDWLAAFYEPSGVSVGGGLTSQIGDIAQWAVSDMLNRTDLLPQAVKFAKDVYNLVCTKVPFDELQVTSAERSMTAGTSSYSINDLDIAGIMSVRLTISTNNYRRLRKSHTRLYDGLTSITNSIPASYARWARAIEVSPPPSLSTYTYRIRYWRRPSFSVDTATTAIITPPEWDELYKWETLYRLLYSLEQYEKAAMLVMTTGYPNQPETKRRIHKEIGIIPRLWNDLLLTVSQRENVDEDFGFNPVIRPYTH